MKKLKLKKVLLISSSIFVILLNTSCSAKSSAMSNLIPSKLNYLYDDEENVLNSLNSATTNDELKDWIIDDGAGNRPFSNRLVKPNSNGGWVTDNFWKLSPFAAKELNIPTNVRYLVEWPDLWTTIEKNGKSIPLSGANPKFKVKDVNIYKEYEIGVPWETNNFMVDFDKLNINYTDPLMVKKSVIYSELYQKINEFKDALANIEKKCNNEIEFMYTTWINNDMNHNNILNLNYCSSLQFSFLINTQIDYGNVFLNSIGRERISAEKEKMYKQLSHKQYKNFNKNTVQLNSSDKIGILRNFIATWTDSLKSWILPYIKIEIKPITLDFLKKTYQINSTNKNLKYMITITNTEEFNKPYRGRLSPGNISTDTSNILAQIIPSFSWDKKAFDTCNNVKNIKNNYLFKQENYFKTLRLNQWYSQIMMDLPSEISEKSVFCFQESNAIGYWRKKSNIENLYNINDHAINWGEQLIFSATGTSDDFYINKINNVYQHKN